MAKKPNIDGLTFSQLAELHTQTEERMKSLKEEARVELLHKLTETAAKEGFTIEEVVGLKKVKKSGRKASGRVKTPKYANPSDSSQTWTGNGRAPRWLLDLEKSGKDREDFLIG